METSAKFQFPLIWKMFKDKSFYFFKFRFDHDKFFNLTEKKLGGT